MGRAVLLEERARRIRRRMAAADQHLGGRPPHAQLLGEPGRLLGRARLDEPGRGGRGHPAMLWRPSDVAYPAAIGPPGDLHVTTWGDGPRGLLVHGSMSFGELAFSEQRPLAERWRLDVLDRRGLGGSPDPPRPGGLRRRRRATSPGSSTSRPTSSGTPTAASSACWRRRSGPRASGRSRSSSRRRSPSSAAIRRSRRSSPGSPATSRPARRSEEGFLDGFLRAWGVEHRPTPDARRPAARRGGALVDDRAAAVGGGDAARPHRRGRDSRCSWSAAPGTPSTPWRATSPARRSRRSCAVLVERLGAEEAVFPGAAHQPQLLGEPFNDRVEAFWRSASEPA